MPCLMDALQTMRCGALRRLAGSFHSVAKQASLSIAFRSDFCRLGTFLGGFGRPKWMQKSNLGTFFAMLFSKAFLNRCFGNFFVLLKSEP